MFKVELSFGLVDRRWSELYYLDPLVLEGKPLLDALVNARARLLAAPTILESATITTVGVKASKQRFKYNRSNIWKFNYTRGFAHRGRGVMALTAEYCAGICFKTDSGARRVLWIGGMPDPNQLIAEPGRRALLDPDWWKALNFYRQALVSPQFQLQIRLLDPEAEETATKILTIDTGDHGLYRFTTDGPHGLKSHDRVRILGCRGNNLGRMRGIREVMDTPDATAFTINRGPLPEAGPIRYTGGAVVAAVRYDFEDAIFDPQSELAYTKSSTWFTDPQVLYIPYLIRSKLRGGGPSQRRGRERNRKK